MALKLTTDDVRGFNAPDAYHRVENVRIEGKDVLVFQVRAYKDDSGVPAFSDTARECPYDLNGANPIKQAYDFLKTLPEFEGAEDV